MGLATSRMSALPTASSWAVTASAALMVAGLGPRDVSTIDALKAGNDYCRGHGDCASRLALPQEPQRIRRAVYRCLQPAGMPTTMDRPCSTAMHCVFPWDSVYCGRRQLSARSYGSILLTRVIKQKPDRSQLLNFSFGTRF